MKSRDDLIHYLRHNRRFRNRKHENLEHGKLVHEVKQDLELIGLPKNALCYSEVRIMEEKEEIGCLDLVVLTDEVYIIEAKSPTYECAQRISQLKKRVRRQLIKGYAFLYKHFDTTPKMIGVYRNEFLSAVHHFEVSGFSDQQVQNYLSKQEFHRDYRRELTTAFKNLGLLE